MALSLVVGGLLLGFGGSAHCAVMCGAPCAALSRGGASPAAAFHGGRALGYMAAGALAAASVAALGAWREAWPALRPLWAGLHAVVLVTGLWLLATGRQPQWRFGRAPALAAGWAPVQGPGTAAAAGLAWVAWPCGLLHSALLLAALADTPTAGAAVMGAFALGSMPALSAAPLLLRRLTASGARVWGVRLAGAMLAGAAAWSLTHGVWAQIAAWCGIA